MKSTRRVLAGAAFAAALCACSVPPYTGAPLTIGSSGPQTNHTILEDALGNLFVAAGYPATIYEYAPPYTSAPITTIPTTGGYQIAISP
jgi:hypothetical protein